MSPYAHKVNGNWYLSADADPQPASLAEYKRRLKAAYGSLRGVRVAVAGKDYDAVSYLMGNALPTKDGFYI